MNNIAKSNDKTGTINSQKQFVTYLENFKDWGSSKNGSSPRMQIKKDVITWWVVDIYIKRDKKWFVDVLYEKDLDNLAKWISTGEIENAIINEFSWELKEKLNKYFKKKGDKIIFDKDGKWDSSLNDFLNQTK
jgi:hypothetical protein